MVRLKSVIIFVIGLAALVACAPFEAFQPEKDGVSISEKGNLSDEHIAELRRTVLCDGDGCLIGSLGLNALSDVQQFDFLSSIRDIDKDRFKVKGVTVSKTASIAGQRSTESPSSVLFELGVVVVLGGETRFVEFRNEFKMNQEGGETHPVGPLEMINESRIKANNAGAGVTPEGKETTEVLEESGAADEAERIEADRQRPLAAYASCGKDKTCNRAVVLLQFVTGSVSDFPDGYDDYKRTLVSDPKVSIVVSADKNGVMKIETTSIGAVKSYEAAMKAAKGSPSVPDSGATGSDIDKYKKINDCVKLKVKRAVGDPSQEEIDQFRLDCEVEENRRLEKLALARRLAELKGEDPDVAACVEEEKDKVAGELSSDRLNQIIKACEVTGIENLSPEAKEIYDTCLVEEKDKLGEEADAGEMNRISSICKAKALVEASASPEAVPETSSGEGQELSQHPKVVECSEQKAQAEGLSSQDAPKFQAACISEFRAVSEKFENLMSYQGQMAKNVERCGFQAEGSPMTDPIVLAQKVEECQASAAAEYKEEPVAARRAEIQTVCYDYHRHIFHGFTPPYNVNDHCTNVATEQLEAFDRANP